MDLGCPPRYELFQRIADQILPGHFEWHDWTRRTLTPLVEGRWAALAGCSNSAKTFNVAGFATMWWLCAPTISSVTFVSTSIKSLRRRGWAEIQRIFSKLKQRNGGDNGNFVDSRMMWQANKGDDKHAIIGKAVEEGPVHKVADDIKGVHTRRQMVIIDEATAVPEAIFDACYNLYSYPEEFILVVIGNPRSKLDQMGKFMEPMNGWTSVSVEDDEWETKNQLNGKPALVVRYDAEKSPNVVEGRVVSKHLPKKEQVQIAKLNGESPLYWSNMRGYPPPDGLSKTVFSETLLTSRHADGTLIFTGQDFRIIGAFDTSRGGDRPTLRFAKYGRIVGDKYGIQAYPPIVIPVNAASSNPIAYQLVEQVRRQCEAFQVNGVPHPCSPDDLGVDATGGGADQADIFNRLWSFNILRIQFGGAPSEDSCSLEDVRPASEVYRNKRAEMYFRAKDAVDHEQMKGVDKETARELCNIQFDDLKKLIILESKEDYKKRNNGLSPDLSDSFVMLVEVARRKGFQLAPKGETAIHSTQFDEIISKTQQVFQETYSTEEIEELV